jgi:hypothetical protein
MKYAAKPVESLQVEREERPQATQPFDFTQGHESIDFAQDRESLGVTRDHEPAE